jgi:hypothetical protein
MRARTLEPTGTGRNGPDETEPVEAVVECECDVVADGRDLVHEAHQHGDEQGSLRDRLAVEGALLRCALDIVVEPVGVTRVAGVGVDPLLVDRLPLAQAQLLADPTLHLLDRIHCTGHARSFRPSSEGRQSVPGVAVMRVGRRRRRRP